MKRLSKVTDRETGLCLVAEGTNTNFYKSIGMEELEVQRSDIDGRWYLSEKCPMKAEEQRLQEAKERKYKEANEGARKYLETEALYELILEGDNAPSPQPSPQGEGENARKSYHIEATDGNIAKLSAYALSFLTGVLGEDDVVYWNTKEDETIALTREQLTQVLQGIGEVQAEVWNVKFPAYIAQIEAAIGVDEVEGIEVEY